MLPEKQQIAGRRGRNQSGRFHHRDTENTENGYATAESNRIRGDRECDSALSSVGSVSLWFDFVNQMEAAPQPAQILPSACWGSGLRPSPLLQFGGRAPVSVMSNR